MLSMEQWLAHVLLTGAPRLQQWQWQPQLGFGAVILKRTYAFAEERMLVCSAESDLLKFKAQC